MGAFILKTSGGFYNSVPLKFCNKKRTGINALKNKKQINFFICFKRKKEFLCNINSGFAD